MTASPAAVRVAAKPEAEGDDQEHPEADPVLGDRRDQDDERRGAGDDPARDAQPQQSTHGDGAIVVVRVVVVAVAW